MVRYRWYLPLMCVFYAYVIRSNEVSLALELNTYSSKMDAYTALTSINFGFVRRRGTRTFEGLDNLRTECFSVPRGDRPGSLNYGK